MNATCPWCSAPRDTGATCPRCGADYAKAEAIKAKGRATDISNALDDAAQDEPVALVYANEPEHMQGAQLVSDAALEFKFCVGAIPVALLLAMVFHTSGMFALLQRIAFTMPVHELGHAITGWFCGFTAIPTLWKTLIPETRGFIAPLALAGGIAYMMFRGWQTHRPVLLYIGAALLLLQWIGAFGINLDTAFMLITFGGDGMGMILATLLMASFYYGKNTQLYKGSLRWGFVVIGAIAFVDIYSTWWKARRDQSAIPYGTMDGMASDSMKLVEQHGWTLDVLVQRYVMLGLCCLAVLAAVYAWGVWRAKAEMETRELADKRAEWAKWATRKRDNT